MARTLPLAFYGDDFTGSTDALECLARTGVRTLLFLDPPDRETLARFGGPDAVGVAGLTRSLPPEEMRPALDRAFAALRGLGPRHVHYKVCSTFDSSPEIGSIGCALEAGIDAFGSPLVPLLVAAPSLGRHCVFGNLFARMGIGSDGAIHRLDRHPAMSRHPVTPADEADLRLHLARQTELPCALLDILQLRRPLAEVRRFLERAAAEGSRAVLIDALFDDDLSAVGAVLESLADKHAPLFTIGSSGVEMALTSSLTSAAQIPRPGPAQAADGPVLVLSGSCSPVTAAQIDHARAQGFHELALDPLPLLDVDTRPGEIERILDQVAPILAAGTSVVVHSSRGADDPRQAIVRDHLAASGLCGAAASAVTGESFGSSLGAIAAGLLERTPVRRLMIAGGDSSSHAARALEVEAVEVLAVFTPGAPLCRMHACGNPAHGREIVFKGGQVGADDLFTRLLEGAPESQNSRTS